MQPSTKPYRRKLLTFESIFIHTPGVIIALICGISGNVDETKFVNAVKKLVSLYPLFRCKLIWDKKDDAWVEETEFELPIRIIPRVSEDHWREVFEDSWNHPIDLEKGPFYEFILIKSDTKSEIIFRGHHMMTDGVSMTKMMDLILRFMNDPNLVITPPPNNEELPDGKTLRKLIKPKLSFKQKVQNNWDKILFPLIKFDWNVTKLKLPHEDLLKSYDIYLNNYKHLMLTDELTEEETSAFFSLCKKHKITINSAMSAAFLACRKEIDPAHDNTRQFVSVDLRRYLGERTEEALNCYAATLTTSFTYDPKKPFWENAKNYHEVLTSDLAACAESTHVINFSHLPSSFIWAVALSGRMQGVPHVYKDHPHFKYLGPKGIHVAAIFTRMSKKFGPAFTMTNLKTGKFTYDYGDLKLDSCIMCPSFIVYPPFSILLSVITLNNKLTMSYHTVKYKKDPDTDYDGIMKKITTRYKEFLTKDVFL